MRKQEVRGLIEQHLALREQMENLREELTELEVRYAEVGKLLYWCCSKEFLHSLLYYLQHIKGEFARDHRFDDLVDTIIHSLRDSENIEQRKRDTPKDLLYLYDENLE
jgi:Zn-finger domain-containing protein